MDKMIWLTPLFAAVALLFALYKARYVSKCDAGNSRMQEIAAAIAEGASAFLRAEYKILAIFIVVLFVLITIFIDFGTAVCFVIGACFSILAGFFGMRVATKANVRTANAALTSGMNKALSVAFSGGSVMGMCVVGLGLLGCSLIYIITGNYNILFGFSLGASSIALFARVGGGSSMDTSKAIGIIIANPEFEDVRSLEGVAPTRKPCVPIIAVPTTAGTAAEVTINYVITDVERKRKFVCVDPHDMPIIAVVDPEMMSSMPKGLTASTGMDALTHAIEGYTTKAAWEMTDMFHLKAIEIISKSLRGAVANTKEGREGMALGQYIAGMGFSNVGLGIAHSMAHTLGAVYDTPHGVACAMMLPIVMEYNADCTGEKYREIARAMGVEGVDQMDQATYRKAAVDAVRKLSEDVGIPSKLEALKEEDLPFLAESAHADACAPGNPKDASVEDLTALFRKLM